MDQAPSSENTRYAVMTGAIGGIAGCTAKTVVAPLDRVKILFQTHHVKYTPAGASIYREYGGHSMQLARIFPYAAVKFMTYEQLKRQLGRHFSDAHLRNFLAGSLCGVISVAVSYPLDMIRVRMAYITPDGRRQRQSVMQRRRTGFGLFNFFRGFPLSLMGIVPYGGVSFLMHEYFMELARTRRKVKELKNWAELTAGGLSGVFAQTASYPFELVRRKMQIAGAHDPNRRASAVTIAGDVWRKSGVRGFFVGLTIGYVKVVPMFAVSFFTYEKLKAIFDLE
ncbi:mitochondrial carrier [Linderina pennispora]|uniref:Mitochondrial carrier n=1 Tax=Linderina pennispora TaxID=61395 RepID=A0A1Y1W518_9FUNG|nr:mitochondrial carrier [Linderina pennispora]ORX68621.1 mitochondrial carrier [Linderina pennispora]